MVGIIRKVSQEGSGIIATAKGEKVPFVRSDVLNPIKPGERVVFALRIAKGKMFARNIVAMPINH
jgi:hypothetical protein